MKTSPLEQHKKPIFRLKVVSTLLVQAMILDIDVNDLVEFLGMQVHSMISAPSNINIFGTKHEGRILRGFYPNEPLFFKLVVMKSASASETYYAKASPLNVQVAPNPRYKMSRATGWVMVDSNEIDSVITQKMENAMLGADHQIEAILPQKIKLPKCMSPKGMKLLNYTRKKCRKK